MVGFSERNQACLGHAVTFSWRTRGLKRWAIVGCPYGTGVAERRDLTFVSVVYWKRKAGSSLPRMTNLLV